MVRGSASARSCTSHGSPSRCVMLPRHLTLRRWWVHNIIVSVARRGLRDLILVAADGVIVESGTHDELEGAGGAYSKLCRASGS